VAYGGAFISSQTVHRLGNRLYGAGDVVWPASIALARLLTHCPSFTAGLHVLELGAGLGLPSCAAAACGAASCTVSDRDEALLPLAARSIVANSTTAAVHAVRADFSAVPGSWPAPGSVDAIIGSDVLYDSAVASGVVAVLAHYLLQPGGTSRRALLSDPKQRQWRADFTEKCALAGLDCQVTDLPGPEDCALLVVTPASS